MAYIGTDCHLSYHNACVGFILRKICTYCRKFPELFKWFKDFLGHKETGGSIEALPQGATGKERFGSDLAMEIGKRRKLTK